MAITALLAVASCDPGCKRTCRKLLDCGNLDTDRLALNACEIDCEQQGLLFEAWEDDDKRELLVDHKRCLVQSTCEEIADGVCYDGYEEIFAFDASPTSSEP